MSLSTIIANIEPLIEPNISITNAGMTLTYSSATACDAIFSTLQTQCADFAVAKNNATLIIAHRNICAFLVELGANPTGLNDLIDLFYLENRLDRAKLLANESRDSSISKQHLPNELLNIEQIALGPRPNQLIAKLNITIPTTVTHSMVLRSHQQTTSRVTFMLDNSGSMNSGGRIEMLKNALINTLPQLPSNTLISIYFYNSTVQTIMENKRCADLAQEDYEAISCVQAGGGTRVCAVIPLLINNLIDQNVFNTPADFENLTIIWLTDGDDENVCSVNDLAQLFIQHHCSTIPRLIAVGVGQYNPTVLNGVAQDIRFKSNLMLHIAEPGETHKLFQLISHNVGIVRKRVILAIDTNNETLYEDLGTMQEGQNKSLLLEIPCRMDDPTPIISCRLLLDNDLYQRPINISTASIERNMDLLIAYFEQIKIKITSAMFTAPTAAQAMKKLALRSIPAQVSNKRLQTLREWFLSKSTLKTFCHEEFNNHSYLMNHGVFAPQNETFSQAAFSDSLQIAYSQMYNV